MTTETSRYAFVTLLTTDAYLPGALVLAHSLRRAHSLTHNPVGTLTPADINNLGPAGLSAHVDVEPKVELVCLVTPATVSVKSVNALLRAFDKVVGVEPLTFAGFAASQMSQSKGRSPSASRTEAKRAARQVRAESRRKLALLGM
jgi:glycogenin glucosyltransferase